MNNASDKNGKNETEFWIKVVGHFPQNTPQPRRLLVIKEMDDTTPGISANDARPIVNTIIPRSDVY